MKRSILVPVVLAALLLCGCQQGSKPSVRTGPPKNDVEFAREAFKLMADGDPAVTELVDWEHLNMVGMDIGARYREIPDKGESRARFVKGFINGFSNSFKGKGALADTFTNWREQSRDASNTVVVADTPSGAVISLTVSHTNGQQYVSAIDLKF